MKIIKKLMLLAIVFTLYSQPNIIAMDKNTKIEDIKPTDDNMVDDMVIEAEEEEQAEFDSDQQQDEPQKQEETTSNLKN